MYPIFSNRSLLFFFMKLSFRSLCRFRVKSPSISCLASTSLYSFRYSSIWGFMSWIYSRRFLAVAKMAWYVGSSSTIDIVLLLLNVFWPLCFLLSSLRFLSWIFWFAWAVALSGLPLYIPLNLEDRPPRPFWLWRAWRVLVACAMAAAAFVYWVLLKRGEMRPFLSSSFSLSFDDFVSIFVKLKLLGDCDFC